MESASPSSNPTMADSEPQKDQNLDEDDIGGLEDGEADSITLVSSGDNAKKLKLKRDYAKQSKLVANILEGDSDASEIQVKQVDGATLELIVKYLEHHKGKEPAEIAKPIRSVKMEKSLKIPGTQSILTLLPNAPFSNLSLEPTTWTARVFSILVVQRSLR